MSRVYAVEEESGHRFLARIECDAPMCPARIVPQPDIDKSGWTKWGGRYDNGFTWESYYCPAHS